MGFFERFLPKRQSQENEDDPLWEDCTALTKGIAWALNHHNRGVGRAITWNQYPYTHVLTELALDSLESTKSGEPKASVFELGRLSAELVDTKLRSRDVYYIARAGLVAAIHNELKLPGEMSQEDKDDFSRAVDYTLSNKLYAPNAEDVLEVESMIKRAANDGFAPFVEKH